MKIRVLGAGCTKCKTLFSTVQKALVELDLAADLDKIENIQEIMQYNVLGMPALVINDKVKFYGKIPSVDEIKKLLLAEKDDI